MATIAILGDGNLSISAARALRGVDILGAERIAHPSCRILTLGTGREQDAMSVAMSGAGLKDGLDFIRTSSSRNTVENAEVAARTMSNPIITLGDSRIIIVTHDYHERPVPWIHRVSSKFDSRLSDYTVTYDLIPGTHHRQRLLHAVIGSIEMIAPSNGMKSAAMLGKLREAARNALDAQQRPDDRQIFMPSRRGR